MYSEGGRQRFKSISMGLSLRMGCIEWSPADSQAHEGPLLIEKCHWPLRGAMAMGGGGSGSEQLKRFPESCGEAPSCPPGSEEGIGGSGLLEESVGSTVA